MSVMGSGKLLRVCTMCEPFLLELSGLLIHQSNLLKLGAKI